jgi:hypothetical protein
LAKADGILAGLAVADVVFHACDPGIQITWNKPDGAAVANGEQFGTVRGNARAILRAERVALNFMQVSAVILWYWWVWCACNAQAVKPFHAQELAVLLALLSACVLFCCIMYLILQAERQIVEQEPK